MKYREEGKVTQIYKKNYVDGIEKIIEKRQKEAECIRNEYAKDIFLNQEKYRNDLKKMLGWPLVDYHTDKIPVVNMELLSEEEGFDIYRVHIEILDGLNITGLFFKEAGNDKKPLVIVQHGGWGTPELISGVYGSTSNYNDMLSRVREKGVNVFAPQLLLWSDAYDVKFDRAKIDARLKRVGSSITAIEVFGLMRILDYFEKQEYVSSFGMVGLSYGGFYTLFTSAIDTRIKSAISCSFFNKRDMIPWCDWVWFASANKFDDAEVASLVYPRKLHIAIGNNDELFDYKYGVESFEKLKQMCEKVGTEWLSFDVFNGTHEFFKCDDPIQKLIKDIK